MVYVVLSKEIDNLQNKIIVFLKQLLKLNNIRYRLLFVNQHINDTDLEKITDNDYILWHPKIAGNNLNQVIEYQKSIVLLEHKTILIQKISDKNPINENLAINYGFFVMYINDNIDITNNEWKIVVNQNLYLLTLEKFLNLLKSDIHNWIDNKIPDNFFIGSQEKTTKINQVEL